jgi:hypothetical protein
MPSNLALIRADSNKVTFWQVFTSFLLFKWSLS